MAAAVDPAAVAAPVTAAAGIGPAMAVVADLVPVMDLAMVAPVTAVPAMAAAGIGPATAVAADPVAVDGIVRAVTSSIVSVARKNRFIVQNPTLVMKLAELLIK